MKNKIDLKEINDWLAVLSNSNRDDERFIPPASLYNLLGKVRDGEHLKEDEEIETSDESASSVFASIIEDPEMDLEKMFNILSDAFRAEYIMLIRNSALFYPSVLDMMALAYKYLSKKQMFLLQIESERELFDKYNGTNFDKNDTIFVFEKIESVFFLEKLKIIFKSNSSKLKKQFLKSLADKNSKDRQFLDRTGAILSRRNEIDNDDKTKVENAITELLERMKDGLDEDDASDMPSLDDLINNDKEKSVPEQKTNWFKRLLLSLSKKINRWATT